MLGLSPLSTVKILGGAFALGGLLILGTCVYRNIEDSGASKERAKTERAIEQKEDIKREVDRDVGREPDPVKRLRDDWTRDR